ncbi:MAG: TetR/AcrR family transcriptional regulator [Myxococcota bacterium]
MTAPPSRRQQTRSHNQDKLVAAARQVFATKGLRDASIQDIVEHSGLSRGTFYNYLGSKEAAFEAVAAQLVVEIADRISAVRRQATDARSFVVEPFRAMVAVLAQDAQTLSLVRLNGAEFRAVLTGPAHVGSLEADLKRDLDAAVRGELLPAHRTDWMAAAMVGATLEVVTRVSEDEEVESIGDFLGALFLSALQGL